MNSLSPTRIDFTAVISSGNHSILSLAMVLMIFSLLGNHSLLSR
jgi:hypothetical protein